MKYYVDTTGLPTEPENQFQVAVPEGRPGVVRGPKGAIRLALGWTAEEYPDAIQEIDEPPIPDGMCLVACDVAVVDGRLVWVCEYEPAQPAPEPLPAATPEEIAEMVEDAAQAWISHRAAEVAHMARERGLCICDPAAVREALAARLAPDTGKRG